MKKIKDVIWMLVANEPGLNAGAPPIEFHFDNLRDKAAAKYYDLLPNIHRTVQMVSDGGKMTRITYVSPVAKRVWDEGGANGIRDALEEQEKNFKDTRKGAGFSDTLQGYADRLGLRDYDEERRKRLDQENSDEISD